MPAGVFSVLPDNFFSILASANRQHYAALLVLYYRLFQENTRGLERELVVREFMNYMAINRDTLTDEGDDHPVDGASSQTEPHVQELNFNIVATDKPENSGASGSRGADERTLASKFLWRRNGACHEFLNDDRHLFPTTGLLTHYNRLSLSAAIFFAKFPEIFLPD